MTLNFNQKKIVLILLYLVTIIAGFVIVEDYGVHIEEKFHRSNGLYWLNYISKIFNLTDIQNITEFKLSEISDFSLSSVYYYNKYGVILDLPAAALEVLFKINDVKSVYYLKHLLSFLIFLLSSFFFYKILLKRFNNFLLCFLGLFLYITTPRIFGDSFLYKDILFLSFFTINFYFFFKALDKFNYKNLIWLAIFSSLLINLRIFAVLMPLTFIFIIIIKNFYIKKYFCALKKILFFLVFFMTFTYIFWPYLWSDPLDNFLKLYTSVRNDLVEIKIFYDNQYIHNRTLPDTYIINWIILTSPMFQTFFFIFGFIYCFIRFLRRFVNIKENSPYNDLWRGKKEEIDFIFFLILIFYYFFFIFLNAPLYNGWRLTYFFNIFLIYFSIYSLFNLQNIFRKKKLSNFLIIFLLMTYNIFAIFKTHPFQSLYFNSFLSEKTKNGYEGDYHGIATKHFFEKILIIEDADTINIAVACHTPIQRGLEALPKKYRNKFHIVGQEYDQADYIFKNNISEVNSKLIKKYQIPKNFSKIYELKIDKVKIYEIYKINKT